MSTTPPNASDELAPLVAELYAEARPAERVSLLRTLLRPVGPLALVALAAGAFSRLLPSTRWHGADVTPELASGIRPDHVLELVRYLEQKSPELLLQLPELLADSRLWIGTISGSLLLLALRRWQGRPR